MRTLLIGLAAALSGCAVFGDFDNRFSTRLGWREPQLLTAMGIATPSVERPQVAMNPRGDTVAAFILGDGSSGNLWVADFR